MQRGLAAAVQKENTAKTVPADIGARIKAVRQQRGLTLQEMGGEELSRSFLSLVEHGKSSISLRALTTIAGRLDVPVSYLLTGKEETDAAAVELVLDDAEAAVRDDLSDECLRLLDSVEPDGSQRARALQLRGWALAKLGRTKEALTVLRESLVLAQASGEERLAAHTRYFLAVALYRDENYEEVRELLMPALRHAERTDDHLLIGRVRSLLGHVHYVQQRPDAAIEEYAEARRRFDEVGDLKALAGIYSGLSMSYRQAGDTRSALHYSKLAAGLWEARSQWKESAVDLNNLALRYGELGDSEEALRCTQQALENARKANSPEIEAVVHSSRAAILLALDRVDDARSEAKQAQRISPDPQDIASIDSRLVLGRIAEREGDHAEADALFSSALSALRHMSYLTQYADAAVTYSRMLRARGDVDRAIDYALAAAETRGAAGLGDVF